MARVGAYIALAALLPSPPLLIHDLGDPKRFHHMLRVWKPSSPMNFGTWALTAYGGMVTFEVARQYLQQRGDRLGTADRDKLLKIMNNGTLLLLHDLAGVPFAMLVVSYTGVLLSCTSNPLWSKNPWISPLFTASAVSTGAEAIGLVLDCMKSHGDGRSGESPSHKVLRRVDTVAHAIEGVAMAGFNRHAGEKAATLHTGKMSKYHKFTTRGIIAAEILKLLPLEGGLLKLARVIWNLLGLSAGWSMRWSFIYGGHEAANDPQTSRLASKPKKINPANLILQPLRHIFLRHVADVFGDQRFDFHLEAVGQHLGDFLLPALVILEPGIGGDFVGAFFVVVVQVDLHVVGQLALARSPWSGCRGIWHRGWPDVRIQMRG